MVVCCDTSFLFSVYGNDCHSRKAHAWLKRNRLPLRLSVFNEYELGNALRFAEFRKVLEPGNAAVFLADFEKDMNHGLLRVEICNLAEVIAKAKRLSATYTLKKGHRSFDIFHVAAALQMKAEKFLSFDDNQRKLARAEKLDVRL